MSNGADNHEAESFQVRQMTHLAIPSHFLVVRCNRIFTQDQRGEIELLLMQRFRSHPELEQAVAAIKWDSIKNTITCVLANRRHSNDTTQAIVKIMKVCLYKFSIRLTEVPAGN